MDGVLTKPYRGGRGKCCDVIFLRPNSFGCTIDNKPSLTPSEPDVEMMKVRFIRREIRPMIRELRSFAEVQDEIIDGTSTPHYFT